jgi:hypothetical protein
MSGKNAYDEKQWIRLINEWEKSGRSRRVFCEDRGVSVSAFQYWRRKIQREERATEANGFIEIRANKNPERISIGPRIILPNGIIVEPGNDWDEQNVTRLIRMVLTA